MILKIHLHERKDKPLVSGTLKCSKKGIIEFLEAIIVGLKAEEKKENE